MNVVFIDGIIIVNTVANSGLEGLKFLSDKGQITATILNHVNPA